MKWLERSWKAVALLGGALVAMTIMTLLALSQREERGFLVRECRAGEGIYAKTRWSKADIPVPVYLAESEKRLEKDVKAAVEFWSPHLRWAGYYAPLLGPVHDPAVLVDALPLTDPPHGNAKLLWVGACWLRRVEVSIPMPMLEGRMRKCIVAHELGHALGLDHDDDEDSVMAASRGGLFRCEITEHDRQLLKETYGE